ncbi:hypothetical protein ACFBZI_07515 [Moraxella sp. ZJ142]|uniref:hypothetical protein n=1 Tax=Moraxella marmotae TaxID=3344520 RepID=UPI0035D51BB4
MRTILIAGAVKVECRTVARRIASHFNSHGIASACVDLADKDADKQLDIISENAPMYQLRIVCNDSHLDRAAMIERGKRPKPRFSNIDLAIIVDTDQLNFLNRAVNDKAYKTSQIALLDGYRRLKRSDVNASFIRTVNTGDGNIGDLGDYGVLTASGKAVKFVNELLKGDLL